MHPTKPDAPWRIAFVNACPYPLSQGSQVLFHDTAAALAERGHSAHLVVYGYGAGREESGMAVHRGARIPGVRRTASGPSLAKPFMDAALVATLRRVVREASIDIVHAHNYEGLIVALAAGKRPVVYHAHNAMADELPYYGAYGKWLGPWLDRTFPKRADAVIASHVRLADYLAACGCKPEKISVIPPSVSVAAFKMPDESMASEPPVLYTGNLDAYQNLGFLTQVMARVRQTVPAARLLVATAHPAPRQNKTGAIEFIDTPDFPRLVAVLAQDCVAACPRVSWSGYPIKLLNAMAAGRAMVACASAAHPLRHEVNGLIVPDNDTDAFAQAVLRLLRDGALRRQLGLNARQTAAHAHNPAAMAAAIESIYRQVLHN